MTNYSRSKDKDYYYKYKALKYYLKNNNIEFKNQIKGGDAIVDAADAEKNRDPLSPLQDLTKSIQIINQGLNDQTNAMVEINKELDSIYDRLDIIEDKLDIVPN